MPWGPWSPPQLAFNPKVGSGYCEFMHFTLWPCPPGSPNRRKKLVVGVAAGVVDDGRHDGPVGGGVAPEAMSDEAVRHAAAALEQLAKEPRGGVAIQERGWSGCR